MARGARVFGDVPYVVRLLRSVAQRRRIRFEGHCGGRSARSAGCPRVARPLLESIANAPMRSTI